MKHWYHFKSKDGKVRGYCPAETETEVASFAGCDEKDLIIEKVEWDGKEFTECEKQNPKL